MGYAHSEYAEDRASAARDVDWHQRESGRDHPLHDEPRHSSEALATTSNVEIEAPKDGEPTRARYWRDRIEQYLIDDPNVGSVGAIEGEDVIGFEDIDSGDQFFVKIEPA